jgi:ferredoxin
MPEIFVTDRNGAEFPVDATNGFTLMEAIRDEGKFDLAAICGGMLSCSTCHVYAGDQPRRARAAGRILTLRVEFAPQLSDRDEAGADRPSRHGGAGGLRRRP